MAKAKIWGLDCSAPADTMIRLVLRAQLNALCKHRDQALNWRDPEGVHDMRVLSRRLRSALNDFKQYFRKGSLPVRRLRAIADALGDVRDDDVALMALRKLRSKTKAETAEGIKLLSTERRLQRTKRRTVLKATIEPTALEEFRKQFHAKLRTITIAVPSKGRRQQLPQAPVSFRMLGGQVIRARLKDFTAASSCLYLPYAIKDHHELRILAKRLRYSVELFAGCWGQELQGTAREIAHMQTSLGEVHDCDVWIKELGTRLRRMARQPLLEPDDLKRRAGATWLLKHFATERVEHYGHAVARLEEWEASGFLEQVKAVLDRDVSAPSANTPTS